MSESEEVGRGEELENWEGTKIIKRETLKKEEDGETTWSVSLGSTENEVEVERGRSPSLGPKEMKYTGGWF